MVLTVSSLGHTGEINKFSLGGPQFKYSTSVFQETQAHDEIQLFLM